MALKTREDRWSCGMIIYLFSQEALPKHQAVGFAFSSPKSFQETLIINHREMK